MIRMMTNPTSGPSVPMENRRALRATVFHKDFVVQVATTMTDGHLCPMAVNGRFRCVQFCSGLGDSGNDDVVAQENLCFD